MPRRRQNPRMNPRNLGNNRAANVRGNARPQGAFRGGLGLNRGVAPSRPMGQSPRNRGPQAPGAPGPGQMACPAGQRSVKDPNTGEIRCVSGRGAARAGSSVRPPNTYNEGY